MTHSKRSPQEVKPLLVGVINMQLTPFRSEEELDERSLRANTRFMIESKIVTGRGVQVIGAYAGEGPYLSLAEYQQLIDVVLDETAGRVPVGVGCMRPTTHAVVKLARYAEQAGADFVLVTPPHYHPNVPCPAEAVLEHYHRLADAIDMAVMVHNSPLVTGQNLSIEVLERLGEIQQIVALKEDRQDFGGLREVIYRLKDRFMINANSYKSMLPLDYLTGLTGHNSFLGNVDPEYALRLHDVALSGNIQRAHELWSRSIDLYNYMRYGTRFTFDELGKEMARIAGQPMGDCERLPRRRPGAAERAQLAQLMGQAGMKVRHDDDCRE